MKYFFHFVLNFKQVLIIFVVVMLSFSMSYSNKVNWNPGTNEDSDFLKSLCSPTSYKFKVFCCNHNPIYDNASSFNVNDSSSTVPVLEKDSLLPYVENEVRRSDSFPKQVIWVGSKQYSISEILNSTDEIRKEIMRALRNNIKERGDSLQLNLLGVKKIKSRFRYKRVQKGFFSSINVKMKKIADSKDMSVDLLSLKDDPCMVNEPVELHGLEFKFTTDSMWVKFGPIRKKMQLEASIVFKFIFYKSRYKKSGMYAKFESFVLEFPEITADVTKDWFQRVGKGNLNISITQTGDCVKQTVIDGNVVLNPDSDAPYSLSMPCYKSLDDYKIPFLDKQGFSVGGINLCQILESLDDYGKITQAALMDYDDNLISNFADVKNIIDSIVDKKIPLGGVAVLNKVLNNLEDKYNDHDFIVLKGDSTTKVSGELQLHEGKNVLVYKLWPKSLKYAKDVDFVLFNDSNLDVQYEVYVKFVAYLSKNGRYYEGFIDRIDLKLSDKVNSFDVGVFKATSRNGVMNYNVSISVDSLHEIHPSLSLILSSDSPSLSAGGVQILFLGKSSKDVFRYDFDSEKWIVPSPLKRMASFSNDDLLKHVFAISNSLNELLRRVNVDTQSKISFDAANAVSAAIQNFDKVVFGDDSENDKYRLVDTTGENYRKTFSDIVNFASKFNKAWKKTFGNNLHENVCRIQFLDSNKKDVPVNGARFKRTIDYVKVSFNLNFGLKSGLAHELAEILHSHLVNLPTESNVQVGKNANVLFEFVIDLRK